jgi:haloacetate dehalogenase
MSRRVLLGSSLGAIIAAAGAARAADAGNGFSALHHGANDPLPTAAVSVNQSMFPGFCQTFVRTRGMMVDGKLAERFTVVLTDLRGYGDSSKPDGGAEQINYAKRVMAADQVQVMQSLGFDRFQAVGHDRGGRVLQFMMLDHPEALERGVVLDIAPTDLTYAQTDKNFATRYFWWFFQIQDAPLPERFIGALPDYYVESHLAIQSKTPGAVTPEALAAYIRTYSEPAEIHAVCEDYRAAAGIDSRLLTASRTAGQKMTPPLLAIWGGKGTVGQEFDVVGLWKQEAVTVSGHSLPCGHLIPEEDPDGFLASLDAFLTS